MAAQAASGTGIVSYNSPLKRQGWVLEGMLQARSSSFWDGMIGMTPDAVIYQKNDLSAAAGHEVTFQFKGNLSSSAHVDNEQAWGQSEAKKLFSDKIRVRRIRWSVDNGDEFDAVDVGDLSISQHTDSRSGLMDLFVRGKDQFIFDAAQGFLNDEGATHIIRPNNRATVGALVAGDTMGYKFAVKCEKIIKSGRGYTVGGTRRPMEPFKLQDGRKIWLMVVDSAQAADMRTDSDFITIGANADIRGMDNVLLKGVIGSLGAFMIIEAQDFFGKSYSRTIGKTEVEIAGLRQIDGSGNFTGEVGFGASGSVIADRALILGKSAIQIAFGRMPDYKWKPSQDFDIKSESALEVWMNVQKTILQSENNDYEDAKVAGYDFGVVVVDTYNSTVA